jgi:hypothetical protein
LFTIALDLRNAMERPHGQIMHQVFAEAAHPWQTDPPMFLMDGAAEKGCPSIVASRRSPRRI